jgi:hypothetical protein
MRLDCYKYELLSLLNLTIENKSYTYELCEILKLYGNIIKDLEYSLDNVSEDIRIEFQKNTINRHNIYMNLVKLKIELENSLI